MVGKATLVKSLYAYSNKGEAPHLAWGGGMRERRRSDRSEDSSYILDRSIHSTNMYQMLVYNDSYDPGV
jgi:hypothetical protein